MMPAGSNWICGAPHQNQNDFKWSFWHIWFCDMDWKILFKPSKHPSKLNLILLPSTTSYLMEVWFKMSLIQNLHRFVSLIDRPELTKDGCLKSTLKVDFPQSPRNTRTCHNPNQLKPSSRHTLRLLWTFQKQQERWYWPLLNNLRVAYISRTLLTLWLIQTVRVKRLCSLR